MVLWLLGISGAGKSTLANRLRAHYEAQGNRVYVLDGDVVRDFYDGDLGFSRADREANIKRILLAAHVLDECGIFVIVANISPFERLRQFARRKIKGYNQIYLKKEVEKSRQADVKGVYQNNTADLVGVDLPFEPPRENELVIETDTMTPTESCRIIIDFVKEKYSI